MKRTDERVVAYDQARAHAEAVAALGERGLDERDVPAILAFLEKVDNVAASVGCWIETSPDGVPPDSGDIRSAVAEIDKLREEARALLARVGAP